VDIFVGDIELETALANLAIDLREPALYRIGVRCGDDALLRKHARVRDRTTDVLGPHPLIDREGRAELIEKSTWRLLEPASPWLLGLGHDLDLAFLADLATLPGPDSRG